jgi:cytochrome c6
MKAWSLNSVAAVILLALSASLPAGGQDAAALYKSKCAMCHGADGKGDTPIGKKMGIRDLTSAEVQKQSDSELEQIVKKGKNKMPAYDGKLKDSEIKDLVAFVRQLGKGK